MRFALSLAASDAAAQSRPAPGPATVQGNPAAGPIRIGCIGGLDTPGATAAVLRAVGQLRSLGRDNLEVHVLGCPGDIDTAMRHPHARFLTDIAVRAGLPDRIQFWSATMERAALPGHEPMHILAYADASGPQGAMADADPRLALDSIVTLLRQWRMRSVAGALRTRRIARQSHSGHLSLLYV